MPIAARGPVKTEIDDGEIEIGRNQTEEFFSWNKGKTGRDWLTRRALAKTPGLQPDEVTLEEGARMVFLQNLNDIKIGSLKNG